MVTPLSSLDLKMQNTALYKRFLDERDQILKNKWYMSERQGTDVGFEKALMDWTVNHRSKWIKGKD